MNRHRLYTLRSRCGTLHLISTSPRQPGTPRAGLTPKPHHDQQPRVALRGSFCLRLASTCNHRPARSSPVKCTPRPTDYQGPRVRVHEVVTGPSLNGNTAHPGRRPAGSGTNPLLTSPDGALAGPPAQTPPG